MADDTLFLRIAQQLSYAGLPELANTALGHADRLHRERSLNDALAKQQQAITDYLEKMARQAAQTALERARTPLASGLQTNAAEASQRFSFGNTTEEHLTEAVREFVEGVVEAGTVGKVYTHDIRDAHGMPSEFMATLIGDPRHALDADTMTRSVMLASRTKDENQRWNIRTLIYSNRSGRWSPAEPDDIAAASVVAPDTPQHREADMQDTTAYGKVCSCGYALKPEARFCPRCGTPVQTATRCAKCGTELNPEARFCFHCGTPLFAAPAGNLAGAGAETSGAEVPPLVVPASKAARSGSGSPAAASKRRAAAPAKAGTRERRGAPSRSRIKPQTWQAHEEAIDCVAITKDGRRAIFGSADSTLTVWDLESATELRTLEGHAESVRGVALTPDGRRAVSASHDHTLKVWDLDTGEELLTLEGHSKEVEGVAVVPDGRRAVSASADGTLRIWDLETGDELRALKSRSFSNRVTSLNSIVRDYVYDAAVTPDRRCAVSACGDSTLRVWDLETGKELRVLNGHSEPVLAVALTPDGQHAISASDDETLKVWDIETGAEVRTLKGHSGSVEDVAVTADGRQVISSSFDGTLRVWDAETGSIIATFKWEGVGCCACSSAGVIVAGTQLGRLYLLKCD